MFFFEWDIVANFQNIHMKGYISDQIVANASVNLDVSSISHLNWITAHKRPISNIYDIVTWINSHIMLKCITLFCTIDYSTKFWSQQMSTCISFKLLPVLILLTLYLYKMGLEKSLCITWRNVTHKVIFDQNQFIQSFIDKSDSSKIAITPGNQFHK